MNILNLFKVSLKAVANNKMRSFLSMLGIIIGVAAVIIMMSIGQGSKESIRKELYKQGHTIIFVTHNPEIAEYSSRNINLRDGKIREDTINTNIKSAAEALAQLPAPVDD